MYVYGYNESHPEVTVRFKKVIGQKQRGQRYTCDEGGVVRTNNR